MKSEFEAIVENIGNVILGKEPQIRLALTCLFSGGHLLIEDRPGWFDPERGLELGFKADADVATIIRAFIEDDLPSRGTA